MGVTNGDTDFVSRYSFAAKLFLEAVESTLNVALGTTLLYSLPTYIKR